MNSSDISGRPYDKLADTEKKKLFRNASYWAKRLEELAENQNLKGDEYVKASEKLYRKAQKSIEDKINAWYGRFAKNNDISFSEAQKRLKTDELEEFKWTVEEYIEKARQSADGSYLKELENASARVHVNRLEFMNTQLEAAARLLYNSTENGLKGLLGDIYEDTYYRSIFEIQKGYGVGASFSRLDTKLIDKVLSQPWAQDGSNFSSRVWSNKEELVRKLKTDFSQSLIRGESRDKIISRLSKDLEQDRKKTARLVHTETAALQNKAALDAYKELGVEKVRILGTLDSVTCSLCGSMDGMILPRTQLEQGVTEPPFHPNCRCTTVPYDEDWDYKGQRIAKDKDGKYYYVPETMSYEEWKREFAQGEVANISKPIEQRNTGKGNPNAIQLFDVDLNKRQQKLLDKLDSFDSKAIVKKKSVNLKDLSALTAKTGDEYAMFTKGNERLIIRGNSRMVNITAEKAKELVNEGYKWSGHTHPGNTSLCLTASNGDHLILNAFNQDCSVVYNSKGQYQLFHSDE